MGSKEQAYYAGKMDRIVDDTMRLSNASVTRTLKDAFQRRHPHLIPAPDAPLFVSVHNHLPDEYKGPDALDETVVQMTFPLPGSEPEHLFTWDVRLQEGKLTRYGIEDITLTPEQKELIEEIAHRRVPEEEYIDADTIDIYRSLDNTSE